MSTHTMARFLLRSIHRAATLPLIFAGFLLIAACDSVDTRDADLAAPTALSGDGVRVKARVAVCHPNTDGTFTKIVVSARAYDAHVRHGDGGIGGAVPEMPGFTFDEDCTPRNVESVLLWDNGSIVTHPAGGAGGADLSMAAVTLNIAGSNVQLVSGQPHWRIAEDFVVPAGGWHLGAIVTYAYEIGSAVPAWTGFNASIWSGRPGDLGSDLVATTTTANVAFSGVYRVFSNADMTSPDRAVQAVTWDVSGVFLPEGSYWFSWQIEGGSTAWTPYVMEPNPAETHNPATVFGNGRHLTPDGWIDLLQAPGAETFLQVYGSTVGPVAGVTVPHLITRRTREPVQTNAGAHRANPLLPHDTQRH